MKRTARVLGLLLLSCGQVGNGAAVGGETHFLVTCGQECGAGLSCIAGVCTRRCEPGFSSCTELAADAECREAAAEPSGGPFSGVCEVSCADDASCEHLGRGYACIESACRAEPDLQRSELASTRQPLVSAVEPDTCDTGLRWVGGDRPSAEMHPGGDCLSCHGEGSDRPFLAAGTVYPRGAYSRYPGELLPEPPAGCFGLEGIEVVIVDGNERSRSTFTNRAGNFYFEGPPSALVLPYTAELRFSAGGEPLRTRMGTYPSHGGCARCHSEREVAARGGTTRRELTEAEEAERVLPAGSVIYPPSLFPD